MDEKKLTEITAEAFLGGIKRPIGSISVKEDGIIKIRNHKITEQIESKDVEEYHDQIEIDNCEFENDVIIQSVFYSELKIKNCKFLKSFKIIGNLKNAIALDGCIFTKEVYLEGTFNDIFLIQECNFSGVVQLQDVSFEGNRENTSFRVIDSKFFNFNIESANFSNKFVFSNTNFNSLWIEGGQFKREIEVNYPVKGPINKVFKKIGQFVIQGGEFYKNIQFHSVSLGQFEINGGVFHDELAISDMNFKFFRIQKTPTFKKSIIMWNLHGPGEHEESSINIEGGLFEGDFRISSSILNKICLYGGEFRKEFSIVGGGYDAREGLEGKIDQLIIQNEKINKLLIWDYSISSIFLNSSVSPNTQFLFRNLSVENIKFKNVTNLGNLNFSDVRLDTQKVGSLKMIDSDLGNMQFASINLVDSEVNIANSSIVGIKAVNVDWPNKIQSSDNKSLREVYRQLKYAMEKQGDHIQALRFQAKEMETYAEYLKNQKGEFSERLMLRFGKWTNEYGQNWHRPLLIILILWVGGYSFILSQQHLLACVFCTPNSAYVNGLFNFLNPAHSFDNLTGWAILVDIIVRLLLPLLTVQTIQAFRKYSRKL